MYANESEVGWGTRNPGVDREEIFLVTKLRVSNYTVLREIWEVHG